MASSTSGKVNLNGNLPAVPVELLKLISSPIPANGDSYRERFNTVEALHGVPEGQRDQTLFKLACKLRNADLPREMAETLILEAAKNCDPPFSEKIALEKVGRVYQRYEPKQANGQKQAENWPELIPAKQILSLPPDPIRFVWDLTLPFGEALRGLQSRRPGKLTRSLI